MSKYSMSSRTTRIRRGFTIGYIRIACGYSHPQEGECISELYGTEVTSLDAARKEAKSALVAGGFYMGNLYYWIDSIDEHGNALESFFVDHK